MASMPWGAAVAARADSAGAGASARDERTQQALERMFDIAGSLAILLFLAPVMIMVGMAVFLCSPGPIMFGHLRVGRGGRTFRCLKFRSMVTDAEVRLAALLASDPEARLAWERDHKLRHDPRITAIGAFLRKTSLDELPQLFNVLRGDMSLVGPRPIVLDEVGRYGRYFNAYLQVRPGITGLWQVSGRSNTSYRRRVALDVAYTRNKSIGLDLRILLNTVPSVLAARGSC